MPLPAYLGRRGDLGHRRGMQTKLDKLKAAAAAGRWDDALAIAAKFPRLGEHAAAIKRAHEALHSPGFFRQIGRDPDMLVQIGIDALRERYGL